MADFASSGTLRETPLPELFVQLVDQSLTGSLRFQNRDGSEAVVHFLSGLPAKINTSYPGSKLGRVLLQLGLMNDEALDRAEAAWQGSGKPFGEFLVSSGVLDRAQLVAALREQLSRRLVRLFEKLGPDTTYEFFVDVNLLRTSTGRELTPVDPRRVLWEGACLRPNAPHVDTAIERLSGVRLKPRAGADITQFGLNEKEVRVLDVLRARSQTIDELEALDMLPIRRLKLLAYLLFVTHTLEPSTSERPPERITFTPSPPMPSFATPRTSVAAMRTGTASKHPSPEAPPVSESRPQVGRARESMPSHPRVASSPPAGRIRESIPSRPSMASRAAVGRIRESMPSPSAERARESIPSRPSMASRAAVERIRESMPSRPRDSRVPDEPRATSGAAVGTEQERGRQVEMARAEFVKAEEFTRQQYFNDARERAGRAKELDPEKPEYTALFVWAGAKAREALGHDEFGEEIGVLTKLLSESPRCETALLYRGQLRGKQGNLQAAHGDFCAVLEINSKNKEAARALRHIEASINRASDGVEAEMTTGVRRTLSKFFRGS